MRSTSDCSWESIWAVCHSFFYMFNIACYMLPYVYHVQIIDNQVIVFVTATVFQKLLTPILRYIHTIPRGTQRQSAVRPRGKSCAMPQVCVDIVLAWLRHAVRCCVA